MCKYMRDSVSMIFHRKILFSTPFLLKIYHSSFSCLYIQYLPALLMNVLFICKNYKRKILLVDALQNENPFVTY